VRDHCFRLTQIKRFVQRFNRFPDVVSDLINGL